MSRENALTSFKGVLTGLDGLRSEMCKVQMLLSVDVNSCSTPNAHVAGKQVPFLSLYVSDLCVHVCFACVSNAKRTSAVVRVCSLAYILIRIQSVLRADCIAAVASAAGSHGIPSPDPDSCYRCCTMLPH